MAKKDDRYTLRPKTWKDIIRDPYDFSDGSDPNIPKTYRNVRDDRAWGRDWGPGRLKLLRQLEAEENAAATKMQSKDIERSRAKQAIEKEYNTPIGNKFEWPLSAKSGDTYHVSPDGATRRCKANIRDCPYGATTHFNLPERSEVDPQQIGDWIKERESSGENNTLKFKQISQETPRDLLEKVSGMSSMPKGENVAIVEVEASISLGNNTKNPLKVSRKIGNIKADRWKDHAYWILSDNNGERTMASDKVYDWEVHSFVRDHVDSAYSLESPAEQLELKRELNYQVKQIMEMAEGEANKVDPNNSHYSVVPLDFGADYTFEDDKLSGSINYATSGFDPSYLERGLPGLSAQDRSITFASGFEVVDNDAGEGAAGWKAVKSEGEGWEISIRGSRGDRTLFHTDSHEEAEQFVENTYAKRVKLRNADRFVFSGPDSGLFDRSRAEKTKNRAGFIKRLLSSSAKQEETSSKAASDNKTAAQKQSHSDLFSPNPGDEKTTQDKTFDSVFGMLE